MDVYDILIPVKTPLGELTHHMYIIRNIDNQNDKIRVENIITNIIQEVDIDGVISINGMDYKFLKDNFPSKNWYINMKDEYKKIQKLNLYALISSLVGTVLLLIFGYSETAFSFSVCSTILLIFTLFFGKNYSNHFQKYIGH